MNNQNPLDEERYPANPTPPSPPPPPPEQKPTSALKVVGIVLLVLFAIPFVLFGACTLLFAIGGAF